MLLRCSRGTLLVFRRQGGYRGAVVASQSKPLRSRGPAEQARQYWSALIPLQYRPALCSGRYASVLTYTDAGGYYPPGASRLADLSEARKDTAGA